MHEYACPTIIIDLSNRVEPAQCGRLRVLASQLMSSETTAEERHVRCEARGSLAFVTLARPKALNALTLGMVRALRPTLDQCAADERVKCIVLAGEGGRAFCAGGDVRAVCEAAQAGGSSLPDAFFREEYVLNHAIATSSTPQVSVWDGIVMGGGAGLSVHGRFRVASEKALFAMPETGIGLFPDVGGSFFLSRLGNALGAYVGLTGARLGAADLLYSGLATHYVPRAALAGLEAALQGCCGKTQIDAALAALGAGATPADAASPPLAQRRDAIERCFAHDTVDAIVAALDAEGGAWAEETAASLRRLAPTSLVVTLRLVREARGRPLTECLAAEFRAAQRFMEHGRSDFFEGIRAALIDKDKQPRWEPATLAAVRAADVEEYFAPLSGGRELQFLRGTLHRANSPRPLL